MKMIIIDCATWNWIFGDPEQIWPAVKRDVTGKSVTDFDNVF